MASVPTKRKIIPYRLFKKIRGLKDWHSKTQVLHKTTGLATQNPAHLSFASAATAIADHVNDERETQPKLRRMNASADLSDYADPPRVSETQYDWIEEEWQRELDAILNWRT
jgi:hypothetical protein